MTDSQPQSDPAPDSDEFYLIQMPVEKDNMGRTFVPKLPHLLVHIPDADKLKVVHSLSAENEDAWEAFFDTLQTDWLTSLQRVRTTDCVNDHGKVHLKCSRKTESSIIAKAQRLSVRA